MRKHIALPILCALMIAGCNPESKKENGMVDLIDGGNVTPLSSVTFNRVAEKKRNLTMDELIITSGTVTIEQVESSRPPREFSTPDTSSMTPNTDDAESSILSARNQAVSSSYTPVCTELNINTAYNLTPVAGQNYCVYFAINDRSRTEFFILQQNANRQMSLEVLEDDGFGNFSSHGISQSSGTQDSVLAFTEPGHYYMWMPAHSGDGGTVVFGAAVNTNVDPYEPNDTFLDATGLPDGRNSVPGNIDNPNDVDYYYFESLRGQNISLELEDALNTGQWLLEYFDGSSWQGLSANSAYRISGLSPSQRFYARVRQNPSVAWSGHWYYLHLGSTIDSIDQVDAWTTENLARINFGFTSPYLVTQVHNELRWKARIKDSSGVPLAGVDIEFKTESPSSFGFRTQTVRTDSNGVAEGLIVLPDCDPVGASEVTHGILVNGKTQTWRTSYYVGRWWIDVPAAFPEDHVGVGGDQVPYVTLGHVCKQTLLSLG
ncbi:hypothetical protein NFC81_15255 [Salinispirillum sp. LH 10-3-1]|uniref:Big-1 domain-containing protein n=1 Tax=Salinispirillum sp. LH 10-3-1 TaxID=2952525 RepID=A0AB38YG57_9GAMM